jgi:hypothetical protein
MTKLMRNIGYWLIDEAEVLDAVDKKIYKYAGICFGIGLVIGYLLKQVI